MVFFGGTSQRRGLPSWIGTGIIYAISVGCLVWVYRDFNWRSELPRLMRIHWLWILLAATTDVLVYFCQGWRWNLLLSPIKKLKLGTSVQAIYIGLFANEVLPLRSGELIRCYLVGHWNDIPLPLMLSSVLIERLVDGVVLIGGVLAISYTVGDMPAQIRDGALTLAALIAVLGALVLFAVFNRRFAHHVVTKHRWSEVLEVLIEGLHSMGRSPSLAASVLASFFYLGLQLVPIYAMMRGYGVQGLTFSDAATVLVVLRLSTVVPGLPGNLGLFNAAAYLALHRMVGVDVQTAKTLSAVMFFVITVPLVLGGWTALALAGVQFREVFHKAHHKANQMNRKAPRAKPGPTHP